MEEEEKSVKKKKLTKTFKKSKTKIKGFFSFI